MSVLAKTFNKPFYVVAESFKFVRMFPISQDDLPNAEKVRESNGNDCHTLQFVSTLG